LLASKINAGNAATQIAREKWEKEKDARAGDLAELLRAADEYDRAHKAGGLEEVLAAKAAYDAAREEWRSQQGGSDASLAELVEVAEAEYRSMMAEQSAKDEDEAAQPRPPDATKAGTLAMVKADGKSR